MDASLNTLWMMIAASLVLFMQLGFLMLEAGASRTKNSINVAQKNISDLFLSVVLFYCIGFGLMFGTSVGGLFGISLFAAYHSTLDTFAFFVFQAVFCATAATIMSGAVAERMTFNSYLITTAFIALLLYPVFGHWVWGNLLIEGNSAWLADLGFIDFAGAVVVHAIGGWVALAGIIVLGPRIGKFNKDGSTNRIQGHSAVISAAGGLILFVGWFGFNGGSISATDAAFPTVILNTFLAGCVGGFVGSVIAHRYYSRYSPKQSINGMLGGLVAITACAHVVTPGGALLIGTAGGAIAIYGHILLEERFKLDDVVGAVSVHALAGSLGAILTAVFMTADALGDTSRIGQLITQCIGVGVAFVWGFGVSYVFFKILDNTLGIRVPEAHEVQGLNASEHGETLGTALLQQQIIDMQRHRFDLTKRFDETTGDEASEIAALLNPFMDNIQNLVMGIKNLSTTLSSDATALRTLSDEVAQQSDDLMRESKNTASVSAAVAGQSSTTTGLAQALNTKASTISQKSGSLSEKMSHIHEVIGQISCEITQITTSADDTNRITSEAYRMSKESITLAEGLSNASKNIGSVLMLIEDIAKKTSLLSLNASIEAERVGEHGKSFAVVANEIRELAAKTTEATEKIRESITTVEKDSNDTVAAIHGLYTVVEKVEGSVQTIRESVLKQASQTTQLRQDVTQAKEEFDTVHHDITSASQEVQVIAANNSSTCTEVNAVNEQIAHLSTGTNNTRKNMQKMAATSFRMAKVANDLQETTETSFKVD